MSEIIGHKDRQTWLPSHVIQDPLFDHHTNKHQNSVKNHHHDGRGGFRRLPLRETLPLNYNARPKQQKNWQRSKGEERMQAFFLVSPGRTTSGTGVFLPATTSHPPTKKPACSPVLLPARVVQALNLNVHENGIHISPRSEVRESDIKKKKSEIVLTAKNMEVETPIDSPEKLLLEVETPIDSPEKLLPDEWIY